MLATTQSRNLRVIESALNPHYKAKNDTIELNADYLSSPVADIHITDGLQSRFLWSTEDYNRFNSAPGTFYMVVAIPILDCSFPIRRPAQTVFRRIREYSAIPSWVAVIASLPKIFRTNTLGN